MVRSIEVDTECKLRGDDRATVTKIRLDSERALHMRHYDDDAN